MYLWIDCFDTDNLYKSPYDTYICFGDCPSSDGYNLCQDPEAKKPENFIKESGNVSIEERYLWFKVHIFWGHNILRNLHLTFVCMYCWKVKILQNFVVFSEYMNFKRIIVKIRELWFSCKNSTILLQKHSTYQSYQKLK